MDGTFPTAVATVALISSPNERLPVSQRANQLVHTLERLSDSYRALLVGERITDAEEILAEVSNALMNAARACSAGTA
jgi:hypothetical protein